MLDPTNSAALDKALSEMNRALKSGAIITEPQVLESYAADASEAPPCVPSAVVRPETTEEVAAILAAASKHRIPIVPRGAGTNRVGSATPVSGSVVLSTERFLGVDIEQQDRIARVRPAVTTGDLHLCASTSGLFYPPDPNSLLTCTVGGNIATNAGGPRAFGYGVTGDFVLGLTVVTPEGDVLKVGRQTKKGVTGYDLVSLIVGSEGTLGVVTEVVLRLLPKRGSTVALFATFDSEIEVASAIDALTEARLPVVSAELLDSHVLSAVRGNAALPEMGAALLMEMDGEPIDVERKLENLGNVLNDAGANDVLVATSQRDRDALWAPRRTVSTELRKLAQHKLSEDVVVPRSKLAALLHFTHQTSEDLGIKMPTYGHAGDGNMHVNFLWDTAEERTRVDQGIKSLFEKVIELKGTLSGEHGIGVMKAPYLPLEQSPETIALQKRIKAAFDPRGILNPGKIFPADALKFHGVC